MLPGQILPPPPPENDDETLDFAALAAMAAIGAPVSRREADIYEVASLPSWTPQTSSAFPPAWSAPPRSRGQRTAFAALGGGAIVAIALCVALVTWSRTPDGSHAATAPAAVAAPAPFAAPPATVAAGVALAAADVAPWAADFAPLAGDVDPPLAAEDVDGPLAAEDVDGPLAAEDVDGPLAAEDVAPAAVNVALAAVQIAPVADDGVLLVAAPVAGVAAATLVEQPMRATEVEPPTHTAVVEDQPRELEPALLALAALAAEPVEPAQAQPAEQAVTEPETPAVPTRESAVAAMDGVRSAVQACAGQRHGRVPVLLTVASDGRVRSAMVSGAFAGTPEGSCIARAVRAARFPVFAQERFEITYPFAL